MTQEQPQPQPPKEEEPKPEAAKPPVRDRRPTVTSGIPPTPPKPGR